MITSPRLRLWILFLVALMLLLALVFIPNPTYAQTATLTPTPSPQPTFTPFPLAEMIDLIGTPTDIPALSLTPKPWNTPTRLAPGAAFNPPPLVLGSPDEDEQAHGFEAISSLNVLKLGQFIATIVVGFYGWWSVNFPTVLRALRMFSILVFLIAVLYSLFKRFAPELASKTNNWRQGEKSDKKGV